MVESKHKYSTYVLLILLVLIVGVFFAYSIDGYGTTNYIPKFLNGEVIGDSSIFEDNYSINSTKPFYVNGSAVCTVSNGLCIVNINTSNNYTSNLSNYYTKNETFNATFMLSYFIHSESDPIFSSTLNDIQFNISSINNSLTSSINNRLINNSNITIDDCIYFENMSVYFCHNRFTYTPLLDTSGNGNNLTNSNTEFANNTAIFNGVNSYLRSFSMSTTNYDFSITAWIKPVNDSTRKHISRSSANTIYLIHLETGTTLRGALYFNNTINNNTGTIAYPNDNKWHFVSFRTFYNLSENKSYAYVSLDDGSGIKTQMLTIQGHRNAITSDFCIGAGCTAFFNMNGSMDNVNIYNYSLSDSETYAIYINESANKSGLQAEYLFDNYTDSWFNASEPFKNLNVTNLNVKDAMVSDDLIVGDTLSVTGNVTSNLTLNDNLSASSVLARDSLKLDNITFTTNGTGDNKDLYIQLNESTKLNISIWQFGVDFNCDGRDGDLCRFVSDILVNTDAKFRFGSGSNVFLSFISTGDDAMTFRMTPPHHFMFTDRDAIPTPIGSFTNPTVDIYANGTNTSNYLRLFHEGGTTGGFIQTNNTNLTLNASKVIINPDLVVLGQAFIKTPYIFLSDNSTQVTAASSTAQVVNFSTVEDNYKVNLINHQNLTFNESGDYLFTISAIASVGVANKHIEIWFQKNGVNVPRSNTKVEYSNPNVESVLAVPYIIDLNSNDSIRIMWASDDTGTLQYTANTSYSPASPSIIMSVHKVGEITP